MLRLTVMVGGQVHQSMADVRVLGLFPAGHRMKRAVAVVVEFAMLAPAAGLSVPIRSGRFVLAPGRFRSHPCHLLCD
jgi:hypothetical protein